jgi:hypothetical protein
MRKKPHHQLDWTKADAEAGTLSIEGTVIRVPGEGLIVQPHMKSKAGMRTIHLPGWVLDSFGRGHADGTWSSLGVTGLDSRPGRSPTTWGTSGSP